jgi:hypothetical protein
MRILFPSMILWATWAVMPVQASPRDQSSQVNNADGWESSSTDRAEMDRAVEEVGTSNEQLGALEGGHIDNPVLQENFGEASAEEQELGDGHWSVGRNRYNRSGTPTGDVGTPSGGGPGSLGARDRAVTPAGVTPTAAPATERRAPSTKVQAERRQKSQRSGNEALSRALSIGDMFKNANRSREELPPGKDVAKDRSGDPERTASGKIKVYRGAVPTPGSPPSTASPKTSADLALASLSGFRGTFKQMGLKAKIDGQGNAQIFTSNGLPASGAQIAALKSAIASEPTALIKRPDFYNVIAKTHFTHLKDAYSSQPARRATDFKHMALTPQHRGFIWSDSCHTLSGSCNSHAREASYTRGSDVSPETLHTVSTALSKPTAVVKNKKAEPTEAQLKFLAKVRNKLGGVFRDGGLNRAYSGIGSLVDAAKNLFAGGMDPAVPAGGRKGQYAKNPYAAERPMTYGEGGAYAGHPAREASLKVKGQPASATPGQREQAGPGKQGPQVRIASSGPWGEARRVREGRLWFWLLVLLGTGALLYVVFRRRREQPVRI